MRFFETIWEGCDGYFFVCGITWPGQAFNPGKAFRVMDQLDEAKHYVRDLVEAGQDVYFTPGLFSKPERKAEYLKAGPLIWSDVDDGHTEGTNPLAVWSSSPGHTQAIWRLTGTVPQPDQDSLSRAVSHVLGCDPGGWDATQLLRVPGTPSHKRGCMVGRPTYGTTQTPGELASSVYRTLDGSSSSIAGQLRASKALGDRSSQLFAAIASLLECGLESEFIPGLLRHTSLNKWGDLSKLKAEVQRVAAKLDHTRSKAEDSEAIEIVEVKTREPLLQIRQLSELVNMPPPRWRIDGLVEEGGCGFIAAPPKHYKSWIMLDMAISLSLGQPVLGYAKSHQAPCLIIEAEDSLSRVWSRVQTILQCRFPRHDPRGFLTYRSGVLELHPPASDIPLYIAGRPTQGLSPELAEEIGETVESMGIGLVCYDTLSMLTTESINDSQAMYGQILQPVKSVAQATGCAQLIVHHTRKASKDLPSSGGAALAGSVALHAWSDNSLYITRQAESLSIQVETKSGSQDLVVTGLDTPGEWQPEVVQSL